jgi:hypothetical protein
MIFVPCSYFGYIFGTIGISPPYGNPIGTRDLYITYWVVIFVLALGSAALAFFIAKRSWAAMILVLAIDLAIAVLFFALTSTGWGYG